MKFNIEVECSPEEFKELMVPSEKQTEMFSQLMESFGKNTTFTDHISKMQKDATESWDNLRETMFNAWEKNIKK